MKYLHTNLVARDWKALSDFYIEVFHCSPKPPLRDLKGDWLDSAVGLENARLKGRHLLLPGYGEKGPTLEIFTYEPVVQSGSKMANYTGYRHLAFQVEDVKGTLQHALERGGSRLGDIAEHSIPGVGLIQVVYLRDPEGNIIEIQSRVHDGGP